MLAGICSSVAVSCSAGPPDGGATVHDGLALGEQRVLIEEAQDVFDRELAAFQLGEDQFVECVAKFGFDYERRTIRVKYPDSDHLLTLAEERRTNGYGIAGGDGIAGVTVEIDGGFVPEDQRPAFFESVQVNRDCLGLQFGRDLQESFHEMRMVGEQPPERLLADPRLARVEASWVQCMRTEGFEFGDRSGPFNEVQSLFESLDRESPTAAADIADLFDYELSIANADVDCYEERVAPVISEVLAEQ